MNDKARQYKPTTIKRLFILSGNQCAEPSCTKSMLARDQESIAAKICHIEGASINGPRYNSDMSDDERRHFENLLILCDECHSIVDNKVNEEKYSVELLKKWKLQHEVKQSTRLVLKTSFLSQAITKIADADFSYDTDLTIQNTQPYEIEDKISYNSIKRNRPLIEEYKIYYSKISALYNELEDQGSFRKENLLRNIRFLYLKIRGKYTLDSKNELTAIRDNADNIIEDIEMELISLVEKDGDHFDEDITFGVSIILIDAFVRCKILEEPIL